MQRFEFSLEQVLKVKKQRERLAESRQLRARAAADAAHAKVQGLQDGLARLAEALAAPQRRDADPLPWLARCQHATYLGQQLEAAEAEVRKAEEQLADARRQYTRIAAEVEALLSLRRQAWEEYQRKAASLEQAWNDEVGLRRWLAARRTPGESEEERE